MIFLRRTSPVHVRPEGVFGLRRSLNTPVVSTPDFPTGPADGAILVHRELSGRTAVTLGIRSARGGETALWDYEGELAAGDVSVAVDAALSFAEGMGFLFDEDELQSGGEPERQRARYLWEELMGTGEISGLSQPDIGELGTVEMPEAELLLEEEAVLDEPWAEEELVLDDTVVEAEPTGGLVGEADALPRAVPLSKFRTTSAPAPEPAAPARGGLPAPDPIELEKPAAAGAQRLDLADVTQPVTDGPPGSGQPRAPLRDPATRGATGKPAKTETVKARGRAALGRLKLVKRRPRRDAEEHRGWLQRVLAAF